MKLLNEMKTNAIGTDGKSISNAVEWRLPIDGYLRENLVILHYNTGYYLDYHASSVLYFDFLVALCRKWDCVKRLSATYRIFNCFFETDTWQSTIWDNIKPMGLKEVINKRLLFSNYTNGKTSSSKDGDGRTLLELIEQNAAGMDGMSITDGSAWVTPVDDNLRKYLNALYYKAGGRFDYRTYDILHFDFLIELIGAWEDVGTLSCTYLIINHFFTVDTWACRG